MGTNIEITQEMKAAFASEAAENLDRFEMALLTLESDPGDRDAIDAAFRAVHGIKGNSDYLGIGDINALADALEGLMEKVRRGGVQVSPQVAEMLFEGLDLLRDRNAAVTEEDYRETDISGFLERLQRCETSPEPHPEPGETLSRDSVDVSAVFRETAKRHLDSLLALAGKASQRQGSREILADAEGILSAFSYSAKYSGFEDVSEALAQALEDCRAAETFDETAASLLRETAKKVAALIESRTVREVRPKNGSPPEKRDSERPEKTARTSTEALLGREIRISPEKVDDLVNLVSELTLAGNSLQCEMENLLASAPDQGGDGRAEKSLAAFRRTFERVRNATLQLRLTPVETLFRRFPRIVRDLSRRFDKKIELETGGGNLEIDRKAIAELADPMIHLIRNAADHGIERPETRRKRGKDETGRIRVSAFQEGPLAVIEIRDDGRGIDPGALREAAIRKGFGDRKALEARSDEEIVDLLFAPGFTTVAGPADVSGRGVGLDAVKSSLRALGGDVSLSYEEEEGTAISLRVPASMALTEALLLEIAGELYALPLSCVRETVKVATSDISLLNGVETVGYKDMVLTVVHLGRVLGVSDESLAGSESSPPSELSAVIVASGARVRAVVADRIVGRANVVVRSLEKKLARVSPFSGAAVMGNGEIVLVFDQDRLI